MRGLLPIPADLVTFEPRCPVPSTTDVIQLSHGGGGRATRRLLQEVILPALGADPSAAALDAATLATGDVSRLAFTTDASVVRPLFFPGGDLGTLAVFGAVNDLACAGARPIALSLSLVLEEGLPIETLQRILQSVARACREAGVRVVTGDTKVVERGKGDGIYTSVAGIGRVAPGLDLGPHRLREGDAVLVSGDVGRHGIAILSVREGIAFETTLESDCAPVSPLLEALLDSGVSLSCLRDPTRGGLSAALNELSLDGGVGMNVDEAAVPVDASVRAACEVLGLDPLSMASEGRLVAIVPEGHAERALAALRSHPSGRGACRIGTVVAARPGRVTLTTGLGTKRVLDFTSGEALPRIC